MATDHDILRDATERWANDVSADQHNRTWADEDFKFYSAHGEQWPLEWRRQRKIDGKPILEVPQLRRFVNQVVNDARLNPPGITVRPMDDGADPKTAEMLTGLIRNIEAVSQAEIAYIRALEHAVIGGMGHFVVRAEYSDDDGWEQDIRIRPVYSPDAVVWDAGARHPLRIDADHVFVTDLIPTKQFREDYPDAPASDWGTPGISWWRAGDFIRVAEYWWKKPVTRKLLLLASGETIDADKIGKDGLAWYREQGLIVRERRVESFKICCVKMTGSGLLSDVTEWAGRHFPVVPVIGHEVQVGDRMVRSGLVRDARDVQVLINVHTSGLAESIAMSTKAKWLVTLDQIAEHKPTWETAHLNNHAYLPYTPDPTGAPPPSRIQPPGPDPALIAQLGLATQDLQHVMGIYPANLGQQENSKSGKHLLIRQKEGDIGTFAFIDNLARAVEHAGRILIDLIPHYYDTARKVRVLGEDGASDLVQVNGMSPTGQPVHDLSRGKYDVVARSGPSFSTKREEARESMLALMQAIPQAASTFADLYVKANDWPMAEEIAKRLRLPLVAQGIAEPEPDDPPPAPQPPSPEQMIAQAEIMKAQTAAQKAQADERISALEAQLKMLAAVIQRDKLRLDAAEAMQQGVKIDHDMRNDDLRLQLDAANKMVAAMRPSGGTGAPN